MSFLQVLLILAERHSGLSMFFAMKSFSFIILSFSTRKVDDVKKPGLDLSMSIVHENAHV